MSVTFYPADTSAPIIRPADGPRATFSNVNTLDVLSLAGVKAECWGMLEPAQLPAVIQALELAMGDQRVRASAARETEEGSRLWVCGSSDEQVMRRILELHMVLSYAVGRGLGVSWA